MYLVIAEKPSVSNSIAKVLGAYQKKDGYLEGSDCIVSWCLGHLAEYVTLLIPMMRDFANGDMRICPSSRISGDLLWQRIRKTSLAC